MTAHTIPSRHGANIDKARRITRPFLRFIKDKQSAEPDAGQWQRLGEQLMAGDPPADALALWIQAEDSGARYQAFEQALAQHPLERNALPAPLKHFFDAVAEAPDWVDWQRLERGIEASALSGRTGMRVLRDLGLMSGYQASGINKTLIMTGALERGAARRVAETTKWWMDCTTPGGLKPGSNGYNTTLRVRLIHALVRQRLQQRPDWDTQAWGIPVNQLDMQATYLAFSVLFLFGQKILGTVLTPQESEDIMHLWRYIGWLMGVEEPLLCQSEQAGRIALYQNLLSQATADESSQQLGRALMDEPLHRHYPKHPWLIGHWDKQVHLSIVRLFAGRQGMADLGLPGWVLPWYPILFAPLNTGWCLLNRSLPGGKERLKHAGRRAQQKQLETMFGEDEPAIKKQEMAQNAGTGS
ncbi:MAG: oxygenase MpaB family protein [Pseudomonadota bacterium]